MRLASALLIASCGVDAPIATVMGNYAIGLGAVHYAIGTAVRQAGGHDSNYVGVELRSAW